VWLANARGNTFSHGHRHYSSLDPSYWEHSMDEMALIDLPAQIDFVLNQTGLRRLAFVGHSQGCTLPLMLLSAKPEYNDKIWLLTLLGAVTFAQHIQAPFLRQQMDTRSSDLFAAARVGDLGQSRVTAQLIAGCRYEGIKTGFCSALINFVVRAPWGLEGAQGLV
jgi:pimeloyl-ACP methyl ester carboxylesterase